MASHETYDLHELLTFKNLCLIKSTTMSKQVQDAESGRILDQDVTKSKDQIQRIQEFITNRDDES
nr:hypothetical protein [Mesobacillus foraminis]